VKRFVLCSSQAASGPSLPGTPSIEEDEPHPISEYGKSKLVGERQLQTNAGQMEWIILRPPAIIGPRDRQFVPLFRGVVRYGLFPRFGSARRRYSFASVHDVARSLLIAGEATSGTNSTYFVANAEPLDWADAAQIIARLANRKVRPLPLSTVLLRVLGSMSDAYAAFSRKPILLSGDKLLEILAPEWVASSVKIRSAWGFECQWSCEQTLRDAFESYRAMGWL